MNSPSPDREGPRSTPTAMLSTAGEVRADRVIAGVQRRQPVQVDLERHLTGGKGFQQIDQRPAREQPARRPGSISPDLPAGATAGSGRIADEATAPG